MSFLDTADGYGAADITWGGAHPGFGHNERLIGEAIAGRRDEVVLATKFAAKINDASDGIAIDGGPNTSRPRAMPASNGLGVDRSICTTTTGSTRRPDRGHRRCDE